MSESYAIIANEANELWRIMSIVLDAKDAAAGDAEALSRLRECFSAVAIDEDTIITGRLVDGVRTITTTLKKTPRHEQPPVDSRRIIERALEWVTLVINLKLELSEVRAWAYPDPDVPKLALAVAPSTLLGYCYLTVAAAAAREPLARCEECQLPFVVEDARQRYCSAACGNRARQRRFKERALQLSTGDTRRVATRETSKGKTRHGKTTRKG
jgi:hypothetical protein